MVLLRCEIHGSLPGFAGATNAREARKLDEGIYPDIVGCWLGKRFIRRSFKDKRRNVSLLPTETVWSSDDIKNGLLLVLVLKRTALGHVLQG